MRSVTEVDSLMYTSEDLDYGAKVVVLFHFSTSYYQARKVRT